ncbi:MAG TPA: adenosine deaminase [Fimbriimonas sp.]
MIDEAFVRQIPKVELHVHLEGSIRPETVLKLARRHNVALPADNVEQLRDWYRFRDFPHFVEVYVAVSGCIRTADDLELVAREFLEGQSEQNVLHTEATYTAATIEQYAGIPWPEQLKALQTAREYGERELGVSCDFILDIVRGHPAERALEVAQWAVEAQGQGVCALGMAGEECRQPASFYREAVAWAEDAGLPFIPHAGETRGPESIWDALEGGSPRRIGHGVRCLEDPRLTVLLRDRQIPLEVCPTSNVCLGVYPSLADHPLPRLLDEGLYVTVNSDDPPMFGTTLTEELVRVASEFDFDRDILWTLMLNAANASLLPPERKRDLVGRLRAGFAAAEEEPSEG